MEKQIYSSLEELLKNELKNYEEEKKTLKLIEEVRDVKKRGYFTKDEFIKMAMWKSPRQKQRYLKNSEEKIISISKKVLATKYEKRRIELLTRLNGVVIPVASAILTLTDPDNYGAIDIRVWQTLYKYGSVRNNPEGKNLNFNNWYNCLMKFRYYAKKFKVSPRDIDRTLYHYHKKSIQVGRLYD